MQPGVQRGGQRDNPLAPVEKGRAGADKHGTGAIGEAYRSKEVIGQAA
jgi:hypothetical protein